MRPLHPAALVVLLLVCAGIVPSAPRCPAAEGNPAYTDPGRTDADFPFQGEYAGAIREGEPVGVQVIARGNGAFDAVGYRGGLPGAGWNPPDKMRGTGVVAGSGTAATVPLEGLDWGGTSRRAEIREGSIVVRDADGGEFARLPRTDRASPTLGMRPPAGAVVLFDGSGTDRLVDGRMTADNLLEEGVTSKDVFGDATIHVEFRLPYQPRDRGQARGNSGVYVQGCYEVQVLDSFGLEGEKDECGGVYSVSAPALNMCLPPLVWQTYDIDFTAPRFEGDRKVTDARMTVRHNGVLIQENVSVPRITPAGPRKKESPTGPLHLQDHGNPVRYRNVWVLPKT